MSFFVHPQGLCESTNVGDGTRVWAFAHVLPNAQLGRDCNICDHVFVENDVVIGDRVTVKCGVQVWDGLTLENDVFIGPNVTFTNDPFPRSKVRPKAFSRTTVGTGASIGANATILPGLSIGRLAMVGAGAVVTRDVPPSAIVAGNPARITGYVDLVRPGESSASTTTVRPLDESRVPGTHLFSLTRADDLRGSLVAADFADTELPFVPQRFFTVFGVPSKEIRGSHAHLRCEQVLVCLQGSVRALVDSGGARQEFLLNRPEVALYMGPMIWGTQYHYSSDAVVLVLASHPYDPDDYIREIDEFYAVIARKDGAR